MRMLELSKWKMGQPTLRVVVVLSVLGAASYVIGACSGRRPSPERQEAYTQRALERCRDGGIPVADGGITYTPGTGPDGGFNPNHLCLKSSTTIEFTNQDPQNELTICFSKSADGGTVAPSPFADGGTRVSVSRSRGTLKKIITNNRPESEIYDFCLCAPDGGCPPKEDGNTGTLEVGTGGGEGERPPL